MPAWEAIAAAILVIVTVGVAAIFGLRQYRQLRLSANAPHSDEQRFLRRTARRRLVISAMLGLVGLGIGATYFTGLAQGVWIISEERGAQPLNADQKRVVQQFFWIWIAILLLLFGIVMAVGFDLWDVRKHWRNSLQRIRNDRRDMLDHQLTRLRAEHRSAQVDPELN